MLFMAIILRIVDVIASDSHVTSGQFRIPIVVVPDRASSMMAASFDHYFFAKIVINLDLHAKIETISH